MDYAMKLLVTLQKMWARYGFWIGVTLLLSLLARTDSRAPSSLEFLWHRLFLPLNAMLTTRMLYEYIAARSPRFAAIGTFVQLWLAWWLAHILGGFSLTALGKAVMNFAPANAFSPPFEALGVLIVTLAGIWFVLAAIIMPLRFIAAIAQEIQKSLDQYCRKKQGRVTA